MFKPEETNQEMRNRDISLSNPMDFKNFLDVIYDMISNKVDYLNLLQNKMNNLNNSNLDKILNSKSDLILSLDEENPNLNLSDSFDNNQSFDLKNFSFSSTNNSNLPLSLSLPINIFNIDNNKEDFQDLNIFLYYLYNNRELGTDLNCLNQKLLQSILYMKSLESSIVNFIETFEKINYILMNNISIFNKSKPEKELNYFNVNDSIEKELLFQNYNKFSIENLNDVESKNLKTETFLNTKRKKAESEKTEENPPNKPLHYRPKRDYELKRKRIIKPKVFKIEKISNKRLLLRTGSKKYILKRIQYCWKSYFLRLILKIVPRRYEVIISKKFYQDHTKGFYLQLFKRLNTVKDLIADVICLHKRNKDYRRKAINLKNMGEFIKEIEITPEIKAFNYKLLDKIKMKILNQTIQMNMVKYFRSKNYKKRIDVYNCKRYEDADLIKFKKPIKFFYSFVFKDFKFSIGDHEVKRSIFYTDNLLKNRKNLIQE